MFTSLRMTEKGVKTRKNPGLSLANKASLRAQTRKNEENLIKRVGSAVAERLKMPSYNFTGKQYNPIVVPYKKRVKNATRKASNKANKNAENHIKLDKSITKLRVINNKLINALRIYDEKVDKGELSGELIDSVSLFLGSIQDALSGNEIDLNVDEDDNPADYVDQLTKYIKRHLINNFNNGKNISKKVREAVFILNVFKDSVKENEKGAKVLGLDSADVEME